MKPSFSLFLLLLLPALLPAQTGVFWYDDTTTALPNNRIIAMREKCPNEVLRKDKGIVATASYSQIVGLHLGTSFPHPHYGMAKRNLIEPV